jgi:hypothetical protein
MAEKTKQNTWDYARILMVFAITGTASSFAPHYLMPLTGLESGWLYYLVYFLLVTPVYMVLLLIVAFLFGKFDYFYEKEKKIIHWLFRIKKQPTQQEDS